MRCCLAVQCLRNIIIAGHHRFVRGLAWMFVPTVVGHSPPNRHTSAAVIHSVVVCHKFCGWISSIVRSAVLLIPFIGEAPSLRVTLADGRSLQLHYVVTGRVGSLPKYQ